MLKWSKYVVLMLQGLSMWYLCWNGQNMWYLC